AGAAYEGPQAPALGAEDERDASGEVGVPHRGRRVPGRAVDPELRPLHLLEEAGEVRDDRDREVLDGARGGAGDGGRDDGRPVRRDDDAGRPRPLGAPADGAEVARVGDAVEDGEEGPLGRRELVGVRVAEGLDAGERALVVAGAGELGELALGPQAGLRLGEPRLRLRRALRREQLEHLPAAAQRLPDRPAAVDEVAAHRLLRTSRKPSPASRTSQPAASIASRSRSASAHSRSARAPCRRRASSTTSSGGASAAASDSSPKTASARRSRSWSRHPWSTASASGVEKSSSSAAANASQSPPGSPGPRKTLRSVSAWAAACAIVSGEKSIGLRQWPERKKTSSVSRPHSSRVSRSVAMLPTDFDIFSPVKRSIPLCAQIRANGCPSARDWASSFSWWGKTRSRPPPWISKLGPRSSSARTEHSMCQPGRPRPQGESQAVSSPSLLAFQSAKSRGSSLRGFGSCSATWSGRWPESRPYSGKLATRK